MSHTPRKRFGQNFLRDDYYIDSIIDAVDIRKEDHIIEIGPGRGALTFPLLESASCLDVIELDRDLAKVWHERQQHHKNLTVHQADALSFDFASLRGDSTSLEPSLRLVGNLPYNISTPLLFHFDEQREHFIDFHILLQKEVADRICANPGSKIYGRLTVMLACHFHAERLFDIPPEAFDPAPKVTSTFIRITPKDEAEFRVDDIKTYAQIVRQSFSQRRKTLRKSLKNTLSEEEFEQCGIDATLRPEALSPEQFAKLANYLAGKPVHS